MTPVSWGSCAGILAAVSQPQPGVCGLERMPISLDGDGGAEVHEITPDSYQRLMADEVTENGAWTVGWETKTQETPQWTIHPMVPSGSFPRRRGRCSDRGVGRGVLHCHGAAVTGTDSSGSADVRGPAAEQSCGADTGSIDGELQGKLIQR